MGFQIGGLIGKSASLLGSADHDVLVGGNVYAGLASSSAALRLQVIAEGRRELDSATWDGILASGRAAYHQRLGETHTFSTSLEWSSGRREVVPFRLTLSEADRGVRGFTTGTDLGAARAVVRVQDRLDLGQPFGPTAAIAVAAFTDVGRLWAGDVPYGLTTPVVASSGISLLTAVPAHASTALRLDIGVPWQRRGGPSLVFRLSYFDYALFWREPNDVAAAREHTVPLSIFSWP
jgi:hypothetical protein